MLDRLLAATKADRELHTWLTQALAEYRAGMPLEHALGLAGPRAVRRRDAAIRRLADLLDPAGELRPWPLAARVERAIAGFGRLRHRESLLAKTIAEIIEIESRGVKAVRCQRGIYRIIAATD